MSPARRWLGLAALGLLLARSIPARADDKDNELANQALAIGNALYDGGRYHDAAKEFREGFERSRRPELLVNAGQAYRKAGELTEARDAYRAALAQPSLPPALREQVTRVLAALEKDARPTVEATPAVAAPAPVEVSSAPTPPRPFIRRHWWVIPASIVVATGIGLGIYFGVRSSGCAYDDCLSLR